MRMLYSSFNTDVVFLAAVKYMLGLMNEHLTFTGECER